ncbi:50S ribosomal protein L32e [Candidatus Woesearchaeota archaeon]|nr:MAG: 50S ribosomal protein L32e [Candidatus Woesearchaeota archaeon]
MKELLTVRAQIKKRKPHFKRYDAGKKKRLSLAWRSVRAKTNKIGRKGYPRAPALGFSSPRAIRGFSKEGLEQVMVYTSSDLESIDAKTQGAIISAGLGAKKRIELLKKAIEKKINVLNIKDPKKYIEEIENKRAEKKKLREEKVTKKSAAQKKSEKKESKLEESTKDEADKKAQGIKQQEKIITQKQ